MEPLQVVIVDDEEAARQSLEAMLCNYCSPIEVIGRAASVDEAINLLKSAKPHIVFLDMRLGAQLGFEVMNRAVGRFKLVIVSAFDSFALQGYKYDAYDFLLKPVSPRELRQTVQDIRLIVKKEERNTHNENIIGVPTRKGIEFFDACDLAHGMAESNYTVLHFKDGKKMTACRTLQEFENQLPLSLFCRVHRSHIVNITYIQSYQKGSKTNTLILSNGSMVPCSHSQKSKLEALLKIM